MVSKTDSNFTTSDYYKAKIKLVDDKVEFSDVEKVDLTIAVKAKAETAQFMEDVREKTKQVKINEVYDVQFDIVPKGEKNELKGRVDIAQQADTKNRNKRVYPSHVLEDAVTDAESRLPLMMDSQHRVDLYGNSVTDLREICAVIHEIEYNKDKGAVSLPNISFVETQAGKDMTALLEAGTKLQVSQRGYGTSRFERDKDTGEMIEYVEYIRFQGFDFVPNGDASVTVGRFCHD